MLKAPIISGKAMDVSPKPSAIQPVVVVDPIPLELSDVTIDDEECGSGRSKELEAQSRHESSIATLMNKLATYGPGQTLVCNVQATIDSKIREELGDGEADSEWVCRPSYVGTSTARVRVTEPLEIRSIRFG